MEPPTFDYVLKPIGGNTLGFDINNIPGLSDFIQGQVHANLGPMMYNPNVFTLNLEELLSGTPLDTACGVLQVTIHSARNLKGVKFGGGQPDPYVALSIDNKDVLAKTRYKHSTVSPQFRETKFILLNNLNGMLTLALMDFNDRRHDSHLGTAAWELKELMEQPEHEGLSSPVMLDGKERGQVQYSLSYYPVIIPEKGPDGKNLPLPETRSGVVRLTIHQAKELDKRGTILGDLNPKARVLLNGNRVKDSLVIKRTDSPIWEMNVEFLVTERRKAVVGIEILNDRDLAHDPVNSYLSVKLDDLLAAKDRQQDWFPLTNSKRGRIRMSAQWKPVLMSGSMNGGSGYTPAIGAVKFWMHKATDVKNVEATLGGKSDPYAQLKVRGQITDRSTIVNNNLNPVWNEILYCPVRSLKDKITIEVMDYQNNGKDRSIGTTEIELHELARESGDSTLPYTAKGRKLRRAKLDLGRNLFKGEIEYECEFLPAVALRGVEFEGAGNEAAAKAGLGPLDGDEGGDTDGAGEGQSEDERRKMTQVTVTGGSTDEGVAEAKEVQAVKQTQQNGHNRNESTATAATALSRAGSIKHAAEGVVIPPEQLLKTQSGILVFNILGGNVARKNARLEILFDDGYWPTYTTEAGRTDHCTWDEVGESVIKELDWSRMWLKLRTGRGDTQEDVFAEFQGNTKDILERALNKEAEFTLQPVEGNRPSTVKIICKYIPMDIQLEPVESVNSEW
jgi:Ca2+-dependent lipid-binding protein